MHHAAKVNVVPRLFSISYEDGVSDLKFKLLSGTNIYKKISPVLGCLRVSDSKGRYINSDISKQSFAIEGSLTKSNLVSLSKATRRVLSNLYSERLFCIRSLLKKIGLPESYTIERCDILQRSSAEEFCIPWSTFSPTIDKSCWLNRGIIARPVLNTGHRSDLTWKQKVKKVEQLAGCSRRK